MPAARSLLPVALVGAAVGALALTRSAGATPRTAPANPINPDTRADVLRWRATVEREAARPNLSPSLVLAVIARESRGGELEVGSTPDYGLMQVTRPAWQDYVAANPLDLEAFPFPDALFVARVNVRIGSWFLDQKIGEMGNVYDGLRAYNSGYTGARLNPLASSDYARWVVEVGEPQFRGVA